MTNQEITEKLVDKVPLAKAGKLYTLLVTLDQIACDELYRAPLPPKEEIEDLVRALFAELDKLTEVRPG